MKSMAIDQYINDDNVLNIYLFGSRVYGTATPESDSDYILIVRKWFDSKDINIHVYTVEQFAELLNNCEIQMLECQFAPKFAKIKENIEFKFRYEKYDMRTQINTITSNSWVKGKKKLTVMGDYDLNLALKSIFHSLRIQDYAIQILTTGSIQNFANMNYVLADLRKMSEIHQYADLWSAIDTKYRAFFNSQATRIKQLCPKDKKETDKRIQIKNLLKLHGVDNNELLNQLILLI